MNLRTKLLLALVPLIVLSIVAMTGILYRMAYNGLRDTNDKYMHEILNVKAFEIDNWKSKVLSQLGMFAENDAFLDACQGNRAEDAQARLKKFFSEDGTLENLFLARPDGTIFMDAIDGKSVGVPVESIPAYAPNIRAAREGRAHFGTPAKSPATGKPVILVTAPLLSEGKVVGIIGQPVELEKFADNYVNNVKIGQTGYLYILDPQGITLAHPVKSNILELNLKTYDFGERMLQMGNGKYSYNWQGTDKAVYFKTSAATGWLIAAGIDDVEAFAASTRLAKYATAISLFIVLLTAVCLIVAIMRLVVNPMRKIRDAAEAIEQGDLDSRVDYTSTDEVGRLAEAFRNMQKAQREKAEVVECIANGDLSREVVVASDKDRLGKSMLLMAESLKAMNNEVKGLISAAVEGKLGVRADASSHRGDFAAIVGGVNQTLDAVVEPIREISSALEAAADKDLTRRVEGDYRGEFADFKANVNVTLDALESALQQVAEAVEQVTSASSQIAVGSQRLAEGANEQASALEEVSSSLEEMASMTRQNADNANQAKGLSNTTRQSAEEGRKAMQQMVDSIGRIKTSSDQTAKIVKTIDEIAFQTNLLALNAAVEAARAGESGKGFAVVAEEVRSLAQRSAEAARNTAQLIEEAVKNAEGGVVITGQVAKGFDEIVEGSRKVSDLVAEISAAAGEQAQGIDQVNTAVSQMDQVTQSNAANSEESASAAEELNSQAEELQGMISTFRLRSTGTSRSTENPVARQTPVASRIPSNNKVGTGNHPLAATAAGHGGRIQQAEAKCESGAKSNGKGNNKNGKARRPEELIPLDESDFKEF